MRRSRECDPRVRLQSAKRILCVNAALFALALGIGASLNNETNRGTIVLLATGYAVLVVVAAIRVWVLRRRIKRAAFVQARFDFAG